MHYKMKFDLSNLLKISIIFLTGFLAANLFGFYYVYGSEIPFLKNFGFTNLSYNSAPFDFIKENQIEVYNDRIIIRIENASIGSYAPTGSMRPILDKDSNGIRIVPKSENDIHIGDIISFENSSLEKTSEKSELIIHRVIEKGIDEDGVYFITKGDNNNINDGKIRFNQIKYLTIGMIW